MPAPISYDAWSLDIDIKPALASLKKFPVVARAVGKQMADNLSKPLQAWSAKLQRNVIRKITPVTKDFRKQFEWLETGKWTPAINTAKADRALAAWQSRIRTLSQHIQHYLSFTIGVQIVMKSVRALQWTINTFENFEKAVVMAASVSGYFGRAFNTAVESIKRFALRLSSKTIYSANEIAEAMYSVASAGYDVTKFSEKEFLPILNYAAAQQIDLADATEIVIRTLKEFGDQGETAASIADKFTAAISHSFLNAQRLAEGMKYVGAIAGELNIPLEEVLASLAVLVDRGYEGSQAGQRLNMILTKLLKPTEEANKALQSLGLTAAELNPETTSLVNILYKLRAAGFSAAEASAMFRARTAAAAVALVENADEVARLSSTLRTSAGITEDIASKQVATLWGALRLLRNSAVLLAEDIGEKLKPAIVTTADALKTYVIPAFSSLLAPLSLISDVFGKAGAGAKTFIGVLISTAGAAIATLAILKSMSFVLSVLNKDLIASTYSTLGFSAALKEAGVNAALFVDRTLKLNTSVRLLWGSFGLLTGEMVTFAILGDKIPDTVKTVITSLTVLAIAIANVKRETISLKEAFVAMIPAMTAITISTAAGEAGLNKLGVAAINAAGAVTSTLLSLKLLGVAITGPIGIALGVISAAVPFIMAFKDEIADFGRRVGQTLGLVPTMADKIRDKIPKITEEFNAWSDAVKRVEDANRALAEQKARLEEAKSKGEDFQDILEQIRQTEGELSEAEKDANVHFSNLIKILSSLSDRLSKLGTNLDQYYDKKSDLMQLEERDSELQAERRRLLDEYKKSVAETGAQSEQSLSIWNRLISVSQDIIKLEEKKGEVTDDLSNMEDERRKILEKLDPAERRVAEAMMQAYDAQYKLYALQIQQAELEAKINALTYIRQNITKVLNEKFKHLAEHEKKVLDIEERIYKLRHDSIKRTRDLWNQLAKEGWITKDLIEGRKQMEIAYGNMMKSQIKYSKVLSKLTPEQRDQLNEWIAAYTEALKVGKAPPAPPRFLSPEDLAIAEDYAKSIYNFRSFLGSLQSSLQVYTGSLQKNNLITSDTADAYFDVIKSAKDLKVAEYELKETFNSVNDDIHSITQSMWNYWDSLFETNKITKKEAFMKAAKELDIFNDAINDSEKMLNYIRTILGDQSVTWENLTDAQAVAALTIGTLGDAYLGLYNVMSGNNILELIPGADSWNDFITATDNMSTTAIPKISDLQTKLEEVNTELNNISQQDITVDLTVNIPDIPKINIMDIITLPAKAAIALGNWLWNSVFAPAGEFVAERIVPLFTTLGHLAVTGFIKIFSTIPQAITNILNIVVQVFSTIVNRLPSIAQVALNRIVTNIRITVEMINTAFSTIIGAVSSVWNRVYNIIIGVTSRIVGKVSSAFSGLLSRIRSVYNTISGLYGSARNIVSSALSFLHLQTGGLVRRPTLALVGEAGPELVLPLSNPKRTMQLLAAFLPRYLPQSTAQAGGLFTPAYTTTSNTYSESWTITGPIYVQGVMDVESFLNELKYRARLAAPV